jgi:hypothetical protein
MQAKDRNEELTAGHNEEWQARTEGPMRCLRDDCECYSEHSEEVVFLFIYPVILSCLSLPVQLLHCNVQAALVCPDFPSSSPLVPGICYNGSVFR